MEFKQYNKIYTLGKDKNKYIFSDPNDEIIVQEKMDGGNFRFMVKDGKLVFGSRTQVLNDDVLESKNIKSFKRCLNHIKGKFEEIKLFFMEGYIYYGECMIKHTMEYNWETIPPFLGFDIYHIKNEEYINHAQEVYNLLRLDFVTVIENFDLTQINDESIPITTYPPVMNPTQQAEGVVFKNYKKQIFAKYVREQFKEENAETFGGTPKYEETEEGKITARFCTNARIDKCIFKLIDDGHKLDMPILKHLPKMVTDDIWEENWREIVKKYQVIEPKKIRKIVTKRCVAVLKQVMVNNAMNDENGKY